MNMSGDWRSYSNRVPSCSRCVKAGTFGQEYKSSYRGDHAGLLAHAFSLWAVCRRLSGCAYNRVKGAQESLTGIGVTAHLCTSDRIRSGQRLPLSGFSWSFWSAASPCYNVLGLGRKFTGRAGLSVILMFLSTWSSWSST